jgi:flagellar protein FliT
MEHYETLAQKSAAMLAAARRNEWETVTALEAECSALITRLKSAPETHHIDPRRLTQKTQILRRILIEDAEIRDLAQPRLADLARLIRITGTQKRVEDAYG